MPQPPRSPRPPGSPASGSIKSGTTAADRTVPRAWVTRPRPGKPRSAQKVAGFFDRGEGMSTCSFEGCDKPIMGKGLCAGHYHQQRRGQELRPLRKRTSPETERLRAHGLRKCTECGQIKPLEDFAKDKRNRDGRDSRCKACH